MSLLAYWPTPEEVNRCIMPEAEGAHDAVLLAVHQPAPLTFRVTNGDGTTYPTNEDGLFEYFTTRDVPTGAHIVPITGASGVGKSHLVRLLAAKLKVCPEAEKYVVVRIPKSASLRTVVELILQLLPSQEYEEVKAAFTRALSDVDMTSATIRFQAALDICLQGFAKELREQLKQDPTRQALKERLDHAQRLPLLLSDAVTVDHFRAKILPRMVRRAVAGRDVELDDDVDQFAADDLDLTGIDMSQAARPVAFYYQTVLQARDGRGRTIAAEVLNEIRDAATRQLFQLHEALGGMSLQDVILEIRRLLLKQGKELLILVEDFKALTGIQETLLNVLIQEGIRDGEQRYATMRSAIAVTDGYLRERDTIATRAKREWIVESRLQSEDEVLLRTRELVAGYLNAARWGQSALVREYEHHNADTASRAPLFAVDHDDRTAPLLEAFGTVNGVPLFPFTEYAIEYLARSALTQGDALVFRPRAIINGVLRDVLLHGREPFVANTFPPASLKTKRPKGEIAQWLASLGLPEEARARYERFVMIYASDPHEVSDIARASHEVFDAFKLPRPTGVKPGPSQRDRRSTPVSLVPAPAVSDAASRQVAAFRQALDAWVQEGTPLDQAAARNVRIAISTALTQRIDWNRERCQQGSIQPNQISIPNARGEGNITADSIPIAADAKDPDGRLRFALGALYRYHDVHRQRPDYDEVDDDLARIGNFLDGILPSALQLVRSMVNASAKTYTSLLAANSRILGIPERGRSAGAIYSFLFAPAPSLEKLIGDCPKSFQEWRSRQEEAAALRPQLTQWLLESAGCFQGKGHKPEGIDITRIAEHLAAEVPGESTSLSSITADLRQKLGAMSDSRVQVLARRASDEAKRFRAELHESLGTDFDKNAVCDAMKAVAEQLKENGNWGQADLGISFPEFRSLCESFRTTPIKEALNQLDRLDNTEDSGAVPIAVVAQLSFEPLLIARRFITAANGVVQSTERAAATLESQFQGVNPSVLANQLLATLDNAIQHLTNVVISGEL